MYGLLKILIENVNDIGELANKDQNKMTVSEFARFSAHYAAQTAVVLGILIVGLTIPMCAIVHYSSKLDEQKQEKRAPVSAVPARIDMDELTDLVLEIDGKTIPLLAEQTENGIKYRPLAASDIYKIR